MTKSDPINKSNIKYTRSMSKENQRMENPFTSFQEGKLYIYKDGDNKKLNFSDNNTYQYHGKDRDLLVFKNIIRENEIKFTDHIDARKHMIKKAWTGGKKTRKNKTYKK